MCPKQVNYGSKGKSLSENGQLRWVLGIRGECDIIERTAVEEEGRHRPLLGTNSGLGVVFQQGERCAGSWAVEAEWSSLEMTREVCGVVQASGLQVTKEQPRV